MMLNTMKNIFGYRKLGFRKLSKQDSRTPFQGCKTGARGYPGLRFAHPGLHARTPFRGAKQHPTSEQVFNPGLCSRTPFQGCKNDLQLYPGLRFAHPGLHARTPFRGAKYVTFPPFLGWLLMSLLLMCGTLSAEPWGKDADLVNCRYECIAPAPCATPLFGQLGETLIKFHQDVISPADGPRSNFRPSSSQYMLDAMRKYGFFKGFSMGCDRLMRENDDPWVYQKAPNENGEMMKWDPVP